MRLRRSTLVLTVVSLLLICLAAALRFVVVPQATQLPADTDETLHYSGTASMLNPAAIASKDMSHAMLTNVPVTADRRTKVESVHGGTAVLKDTLTLNVGGQAIPSSHVYAVDRSSLKGAKAPAGTTVEPVGDALSVGFPVGPQSGTHYKLYDPTTRVAAPAEYAGTATRKGRSVYVYKMTATGPVKDPATLASYPAALSKETVAALLPSMPETIRALLTPAVLKALPPSLPLTYSGTSTAVLYVDQQTGITIDQTLTQQVMLGSTLGGGSAGLLPVLSVDLKLAPASLSHLASEADSAGLLLTALGMIAPVALLAIAVVIAAGLLLRSRRRPATLLRPTASPAAKTPAEETEPQEA